jgi:hypothetical protein
LDVTAGWEDGGVVDVMGEIVVDVMVDESVGVIDAVGGGLLDEVPLERLEHELVSMAAHLAAGEARWLAWLAVYDRRQGWESWGCRSAAHWLNWKCAMSLAAGRERVRVARALEDLPVTMEAFSQGELSYSKARAITRAATPDSEADLVDLARSCTAAQLDRICGGVVTARNNDDDDVALAKQFASSRSNNDGTSTLTVRLTDDAMRLVVAAIDAKLNEIVCDAASEEGLSRTEVVNQRGGAPALRAQALAAIAVDGGAETTVVFTVPHTATEEGFSPVVERLACDCRVNMAVINDDGTPLSVGRETRVVPKPIRTALELRDHGMCQFPGCASTRGLHAHHVIHWLNGGPTELDNLILLCSFHHHAVHGDPAGSLGLWAVERHHGRFRFRTPGGEIATIGHSRGSVLDLYWYSKERVNGNTRLEPINGDRIKDLSWITTVVLHNEQNRKRRRP